jgi:ribosome maturation factor RimP
MRGNGHQPVFLFLMTERFDRLTRSRKKEKRTEIPLLKPSRLTRNEVISKVNELAAPLCNAEGIELVFTEYQREPHGMILRIYIDKPGGTTLQDCTLVSRQLQDLLDVHLDVSDNYYLEVSSPGLNRPLGKLSDFVRFKGRQAKIKVIQPIDGQKQFTGILSGVLLDTVAIQVGDRIVEIPYQDITRARLVNYNGDI